MSEEDIFREEAVLRCLASSCGLSSALKHSGFTPSHVSCHLRPNLTKESHTVSLDLNPQSLESGDLSSCVLVFVQFLDHLYNFCK